jgi:Tol biopolymer transport system component
MNADGTNQTRLTTDPATDDRPAFSTDGSKIVFHSNRDGDTNIYMMNADGSGQTRLTIDPADDESPVFSPDGSKIAFWSERDGNKEIYVMNADGTSQTRLTSDPMEDSDPAFSPDGSKIAFHSNRNGNGEIYVMNANGSGTPTNLTNHSAGDGDPVFSWDGSKIAFHSNREGNWEIHLMNADGSGNPINLTNHSVVDVSPAFNPGGSKIAFVSDRDSNYEIYVVNADGTNQSRLTNNPATDHYPSWAPGDVVPADTIRPASVTITNPANGAVVRSLPSVSGRAADNVDGSDIRNVNLYLGRPRAGGSEYWSYNGTSWGWSTTVRPITTTLSNPGAVNTGWSCSPLGAIYPMDAITCPPSPTIRPANPYALPAPSQ